MIDPTFTAIWFCACLAPLAIQNFRDWAKFCEEHRARHPQKPVMHMRQAGFIGWTRATATRIWELMV